MQPTTSTTTAASALLSWLAGLQLGAPRDHGRLTLFPAYPPQPSLLDYVTLSEALSAGWATVSEQPTASVPELVLVNLGERMLLVLDGEEIVGGRQNRIVNASFLVAGGAMVILPVSCVEHGRWHGAAPHFSAGEASYASLRAAKLEQVRANLEACGAPVADQGAIWNELAERQVAAHCAAPTGAMHDLYRDRAHELAGYETELPYPEGACGLIAALGGAIVGADLFDQPRTASVLWRKLVRSYALDALQCQGTTPATVEGAQRFLAWALAARLETYRSLALGEDVRLSGDRIAGASLVYQGIPVHTSLFARRAARYGVGPKIRNPRQTGTGPRVVRF